MSEVSLVPTHGCQRKGCVNLGNLDPQAYIGCGYRIARDGTRLRKFTCRGCSRSVTNKKPQQPLMYGCPHKVCENHGKVEGELYVGGGGQRFVCKCCCRLFTDQKPKETSKLTPSQEGDAPKQVAEEAKVETPPLPSPIVARNPAKTRKLTDEVATMARRMLMQHEREEMLERQLAKVEMSRNSART